MKVLAGVGIGLGALAVVGALISGPDIIRYLKIRSM